jgi:tetratricopeptide (TPR) repeat protein
MSRDLTRKKLKQDEFVESVFSIEQWVEDHWRTLARWTGGIAAVALIASGWLWWSGRRADEAHRLFGDAFKEFNAASTAAAPAEGYGKALALFEQSADLSGGAAAWSADFYRASSLLELERVDEAIGILERLEGNAPNGTLAAGARMQLANAYEQVGRNDEAIDTLRTVADGEGGYTPSALLRMGTLLLEAGRDDEAREALKDLTERYPASGAATDGRRVLQRLEP